jgi:hypothetical protein
MNKKQWQTQILLAALIGGMLLGAVAATAAEPPNVKRLGKTVAQFKDDKIQVAVSWKYPSLHADEKWAFFETWAMPVGNPPVKINREDITLFFPDGTRISLPNQKSLIGGLPDIRRVLAVGNVSRDPMGAYFWARQRLYRLGLHEVPTTATAFNFCALGSRDAAYGDLFFESPKGNWEKGLYTLEIKNKEIDVKIPIALGLEE